MVEPMLVRVICGRTQITPNNQWSLLAMTTKTPKRRSKKKAKGNSAKHTVVPSKSIPEIESSTAEVPPEHTQTQREGHAAWRQIRSGGHYADHCKVRNLLMVYRDMALRVSGANSHQSPLYKKAFGTILAADVELAVLLEKKYESYRTRLLQLTPDIDRWHAALPEDEKIKNNYPGTVLANHRRYLKAAAGASDEREAAKAAKKAKAEEEARIAANNAQVNADAVARADAAEAELAKMKANGGNDAAGATGDASGATGDAAGATGDAARDPSGATGDASGGDPITAHDLFTELLEGAGHDHTMVQAVVELGVAWLAAEKN